MIILRLLIETPFAIILGSLFDREAFARFTKKDFYCFCAMLFRNSALASQITLDFLPHMLLIMRMISVLSIFT